MMFYDTRSCGRRNKQPQPTGSKKSALSAPNSAGWTNKHTHAILGRLVRIGIIKNIGRPAHPDYRLVQRWQAKISSPKAKKSKPAAPSVVSVCRQNWQGYHIHKIFGSSRA